VLQVIDPRSNIDQRSEHRVLGDVPDALAIDVDLSIVANGVEVLFTGPDHGAFSKVAGQGGAAAWPRIPLP
jgi:hypothetical protein